MGRIASLSDEALLGEAIGGSPEAWAELVERYHGKGMRIIRRQLNDPYLAEDIMQNLWSTLVTAVLRQRPDKFAALFHALLRRRLVDELRKRGRTREAAILDGNAGREGEGRSLLEQQPSTAPDPLEETVRSDDQRLLRQAMAELPDHYRRTIECRHLCGLSNKETAARLAAEGLVPGEDGAEKRVENYYYRGLRELRRRLEALGYEYQGGTRT